MKNTNLLKAIRNVKVVSFDIFDTLLKRNVRHPKDVFNIVELRYNETTAEKISGFRKVRAEAEEKARQSATAEDITLEQIYALLPYEKSVSEQLKQLELQAEADALVCNPQLKEVFDCALAEQKTVVIISDMYLPASFLQQILSREGYTGYKKLYVSNEEGLLKSTGNLFRLAMKELGCKPREMLHIGDSKRGDLLAPFKLGIKVRPIATHYNNALYHVDLEEQSLSRNIVYSFINNKSFENRFVQIGYETLGPLLFGFSKWIHGSKQHLGLEKLLFFSRDGEIMKKAYDMLYANESTEYVYMSRRSLLVPLFWQCKSWNEIIDLIPMTRFTQVKAFFDMVGLDASKYESTIKNAGFSQEDFLPLAAFHEDGNLQKMLESILADVQENSKKEFELFAGYIGSLSIPAKYGIVDIGWKGTMQRSFEKLLTLQNSQNLPEGFYIGLTSDLPRGNGFLFSSGNMQNHSKVWSFLGLFEMLFSASHGSVKKYVSSENCPVEMYDFEFNFNEETKESYKRISEIQQGALQFIKDFSKHPFVKYVEWDPELSFEGLCNFGINTLPEDLAKVSKWKFYNTTLLPLAEPKISLNPKAMKKDFSNSAWKIAYLRRLMKLPLPYFKIYEAIKNMVR